MYNISGGKPVYRGSSKENFVFVDVKPLSIYLPCFHLATAMWDKCPQ